LGEKNVLRDRKCTNFVFLVTSVGSIKGLRWRKEKNLLERTNLIVDQSMERWSSMYLPPRGGPIIVYSPQPLKGIASV